MTCAFPAMRRRQRVPRPFTHAGQWALLVLFWQFTPAGAAALAGTGGADGQWENGLLLATLAIVGAVNGLMCLSLSRGGNPWPALVIALAASVGPTLGIWGFGIGAVAAGVLTVSLFAGMLKWRARRGEADLDLNSGGSEGTPKDRDTIPAMVGAGGAFGGAGASAAWAAGATDSVGNAIDDMDVDID